MSEYDHASLANFYGNLDHLCRSEKEPSEILDKKCEEYQLKGLEHMVLAGYSIDLNYATE